MVVYRFGPGFLQKGDREPAIYGVGLVWLKTRGICASSQPLVVEEADCRNALPTKVASRHVVNLLGCIGWYLAVDGDELVPAEEQ